MEYIEKKLPRNSIHPLVVASPPRVNLSPHTRVYIGGVCWDKIQPYPKVVGSHTYIQIPVEVSVGSKRSSAC